MKPYIYSWSPDELSTLKSTTRTAVIHVVAKRSYHSVLSSDLIRLFSMITYPTKFDENYLMIIDNSGYSTDCNVLDLDNKSFDDIVEFYQGNRHKFSETPGSFFANPNCMYLFNSLVESITEYSEEYSPLAESIRSKTSGIISSLIQYVNDLSHNYNAKYIINEFKSDDLSEYLNILKDQAESDYSRSVVVSSENQYDDIAVMIGSRIYHGIGQVRIPSVTSVKSKIVVASDTSSSLVTITESSNNIKSSEVKVVHQHIMSSFGTTIGKNTKISNARIMAYAYYDANRVAEALDALYSILDDCPDMTGIIECIINASNDSERAAVAKYLKLKANGVSKVDLPFYNDISVVELLLDLGHIFPGAKFIRNEDYVNTRSYKPSVASIYTKYESDTIQSLIEDAVSVDSLIINQESTKLSYRYLESGIVHLLPKLAKKVGIDPEVHVKRWKSQSIINDGELYQNTLRIYCKSYTNQHAKDIIGSLITDIDYNNHIITLDLTKIPVARFRMTSRNYSDIARIDVELLNYKIEDKIVSHFINRINSTNSKSVAESRNLINEYKSYNSGNQSESIPQPNDELTEILEYHGVTVDKVSGNLIYSEIYPRSSKVKTPSTIMTTSIPGCDTSMSVNAFESKYVNCNKSPKPSKSPTISNLMNEYYQKYRDKNIEELEFKHEELTNRIAYLSGIKDRFRIREIQYTDYNVHQSSELVEYQGMTYTVRYTVAVSD